MNPQNPQNPQLPTPTTSPVVTPSSHNSTTQKAIASALLPPLKTVSNVEIPVPVAPQTVEVFSILPGVNVLLEGPTGTGKTTAIAKIAELFPQLEVFFLFVDPAVEVLVGYYTDRGKPVPDNLHWHVLERPRLTFETLAQGAEQVNNAMTFKAMADIIDPNKTQHNQYAIMQRAMTNFPSDKTGLKYGPVDKWGPNRLFVLSTLSGVNPIALSLVCGTKPVRSQGEWYAAQQQIERFMRQLTDGCKCHVVVEAHVEREPDPVQGGSKITVSTLGKSLAPMLPAMFSDVILTVRDGTKFHWTTANSMADLKARYLPIADNIEPSFKQIFDKWLSRGGKFVPKVKT